MNEEKMLALSWKEPFASLMLFGKIETRTWSTNYRGPVLICATKKDYSLEQIVEISGEELSCQVLNVLNKWPTTQGYAIAVGQLVDCRPMTKKDEDKCFVKYDPELYCHVYENVRRIKPFAWKGSQGWKTVSQDVIDGIEYVDQFKLHNMTKEEFKTFSLELDTNINQLEDLFVHHFGICDWDAIKYTLIKSASSVEQINNVLSDLKYKGFKLPISLNQFLKEIRILANKGCSDAAIMHRYLIMDWNVPKGYCGICHQKLNKKAECDNLGCFEYHLSK